MNEWINIKDKLPNHHETILARTTKGFCVCVFVDTNEMNKTLRANGYPEEQWNANTKPYSFCSQEIRGNVLNGVTHWMPLPSPPEDKE
jgi:Protein of unknown function (DUF551)